MHWKSIIEMYNASPLWSWLNKGIDQPLALFLAHWIPVIIMEYGEHRLIIKMKCLCTRVSLAGRRDRYPVVRSRFIIVRAVLYVPAKMQVVINRQSALGPSPKNDSTWNLPLREGLDTQTRGFESLKIS